MTAVGVLFILLGVFLSVGLAAVMRSPFCIVLFVYHLGTSIFYWRYSLTNVADAEGYYSYTAYFSDFDLGGNFIEWFTAYLRDSLQASYLDLFMLYHLFGYAGLVLFHQLCRELVESDAQPRPRLQLIAHAVCLLPGLHFWTSAIGKDGLIFFAILCVIWSTVDPGRRFLALLLGLAICSLIRPHIAALLAAACGLSAALGAGIAIRWRVLLFVTLLGALIPALPFLQHFVGLETLDSASVETGIERRQGYNLEGGSSVAMSSYSLPVQIFTYLYRPLFDARGGLGIIASLENLFLLGLSLAFAAYVPRVVRVGPRAFFVRFNLTFWSATTLVLAATTSNLGIASRQKTMVVPSLLLLLLAGAASRRTAAIPGNDGPEHELPGDTNVDDGAAPVGS